MPVALVISQSHLARDPRVRRTVGTLLEEGWDVDGLFLDAPRSGEHLRTWRFPLDHKRSHVIRYLIEYSLFFAWALCWVLWRLLVHRPALVYVNSPPDFLAFAAIPARFFGVPILLDVHDPMPELFSAKGRQSRLVHRLLVAQERWSIRFADTVVTVHEPLKKLFEGRVPGVAIHVVMNVPDLKGWGPLTWDPASRVLVFAGTVAVRYGIDDVIRAVGMVTDRIPRVRLRLVGDGEDETALLALADSIGVGECIDRVGRVPHEAIPSVLKGSWAGVNVPKPDELGALSFSNKIVEWVMLGLPVIAGRTETLLQYFSEDCLFYVEPGSPESIAARLIEIDQTDGDELQERIRRAKAAAERIRWPVQRAELVRAVQGSLRQR